MYLSLPVFLPPFLSLNMNKLNIFKKLTSSQTVLSSGKKVLIVVMHEKDSTLKVTKVKICQEYIYNFL